MFFKIIYKRFFKGFSESFNSLSLGSWQGPIQSIYGSHLVKIIESKEEYMPSFQEIISQVRIDFLLEQRDSQIKSFVDQLKTDYRVVISPKFTQ